MKKILRLFFSRFTLFAVLFLLQAAIISLLVTFFFELLAALAWQLEMIVLLIILINFFAIVNRRETPEFKLPWIVLVLGLPVFGTFLYLLFAHPRMKKKDSRALNHSKMKAQPYVDLSEGEAEKQAAFLGDQKGLGNYLSQTAHLNGRLDNNVKYYPLGEDLWQDLLEDLKKAEHFIFMEYFIIDPGKMWKSILEILKEKAAAGVEVRVLYDDIGTVSMLPAGYCRKLRKMGIKAYKFNPFRPVMSGIFNNRDHRKITVIDGKVGYTGGVNLGDEYINENHRLGHWKDTGLRIEGSAVNNLTTLFLQSYDIMSKSLTDFEKYYITDHKAFPGGGYIHVFGDGPKPYYSEQIGENNYINLIDSAKKYVYITTPYLVVDHTMVTAICNAARRGVDVRIVIPHIPDKKIVFNITKSNFPYFSKAGVRMYQYTPGFIHAKMLIADDQVAFVGTINLDYRSFTHHYECGATLCGTPCITEIKKDFDHILEVSQEMTQENYKLGKVARLINSVLQLFTPLF